MSDPDPTSSELQKIGDARVNPLSIPAEPFRGFALPEAVLHSIPLPPEFDELVKSATIENRVETILPSFFNPLFRRQGVVNKHTIHALESVGQSLTHLAREIEGRDRVLEQLTSHLNAYGEHAHQSHLALAHSTEHLAWQVAEATNKLQSRLNEEARHVGEVMVELNARLEREAAETRLRTDSLVAIARTIEKRLGQQQATTAEISGQINEIKSSTAQHESTLKEQLGRLVRSDQLNAAQLAELSQQTKALQAVTQASDARWAEVPVLIEKIRNEIETTHANTAVQFDGQLAQLIERFVEIQALVAAARSSARVAAEEVRRDSDAALAALAARTEEQTAELRDAMRRELHARLAEGNALTTAQVDELRHQSAQIQTAQHAAIDGKLTALDSEMARFMATMEERMTRLEQRFTEQKIVDTQVEPLVSALRATSRAQELLSTELDILRNNLLAVAESNSGITRRQEATEATLGATSLSLNDLLPSLNIQLDRLIKSGPTKQRDLIVQQAQETVEATQLAASDAFYVALEARFRGPRAVIRERQSRYLPLVEEARQRVDFFPPPPLELASTHPLAQLRANRGVLDLGCGRGEWLDLLKDHGVPALGVDQNRFFLQTCRENNYDVVDADLINFLRTAPDESVAVVTSFHVIEHLPIPVFQEMVRHVARILRRGGTAIFETPNPTNMLTSSLNFLLDPTHLRPIHPQFASLVLETAGFTSVRLEYLSPYDASHHVGNPGDPLAKRFNEYFHGPQEYAVIGIKP